MKKDSTSVLNALAVRIDAFAPEYAGPLMVKGETLVEQAYPPGYRKEMYMKILPWIRKYLTSWKDTFDGGVQIIQEGLVGVRITGQMKETRQKCSLTIMIWQNYIYRLMNPIEMGADTEIPFTISEKEFINTLHYALTDTYDFFQQLEYNKHNIETRTMYGPHVDTER
jgi:hypothetical protein